jgi:hypothetical protein
VAVGRSPCRRVAGFSNLARIDLPQSQRCLFGFYCFLEASMANKSLPNKLQERDPALWGIVAVILGVTAVILWHWYMS